MHSARPYLTGLLVLVGAAAAAGPAPTLVPSDRQPLVLAAWYREDPRELDPVEELIRSAQETVRPKILVTLTRHAAADAFRQLDAWSASGARGVPDVVVLRDEWLPHFAASLQPLNALLDARDLRGIPSGVKRRLRYAGNLYGVPWSVDSWVLYYRTDLLAAGGQLPPRTWDELVVAARRVHKPPDVYGFGLPGIRDGGAAQLLLQLLWGQGADLPAVGSGQEVDLERAQVALGLYQQLHGVAEPEVLSWGRDELEAFFAAGRLGMVLGPASLGAPLREAAPELAWATAALPAGLGGSGRVSVELAAIPKASSHQPAAAAFLKALTTPEACEVLARLGSVPFHSALRAKCLASPEWAGPVAHLEAARGLPVEGWESRSAALSEGLLYLLTGRKSVAEAAVMVRDGLAGVPAAAEAAP